MLLPKKMKYRKHQRGRRRGFAKGQTTVQFGDYFVTFNKKGQPKALKLILTR